MTNIVPFRSLLTGFNRWPAFFDEDDFSLFSTSLANNVDVYETENEVIVRTNVAGVPEDDIDVTFEKGILWIRAQVKKQEEDKKRKYYSQASWAYSYKIAVPGSIDYRQEPEVTLDNGILTIAFAKSEASKPKKLTVKRKK